MSRPRVFKLKRNHNCEAPSQIIALGVATREVDNEKSEALASVVAVAVRRKGSTWYGQQQAEFANGVDLWNWVRIRCRPREPIWVFGHGWHQSAILTGLWAEFDAGRFSLGLPARTVTDANGNGKAIRPWHGLCAIEAKPFVVFACSVRGTVKIVDVTNYYDMSMDEILSKSGYVEGTDDYKPMTDGGYILMAERRASAIALLMESTINAWLDGNRGNWQPTAGRLAMSNYMHEFGPDHDITINNDLMDREAHRLAYFGGRFSNWYKGFINGPLYKVDQTASYPAQMSKGLFPSAVSIHAPVASILGRCEPPEPAACIAAVEVDGHGDLPCRRDDGIVTFPVGRFFTSLAGPELDFAVSAGRVQSWHGWTSFIMKPIFSRYVEYWWSIRRQAQQVGDYASQLLAKLMMNCLYGKFGSLRPRWTMTDEVTARERWGHFCTPDPENGKFTMWRSIAGTVMKQRGKEEKEDSFPAISAFVTAAQRMEMNRVRQVLPARSVILQQCDSLLLTESGYEALTASEFWGPGMLGMFRDVDIVFWADVAAANLWISSDIETLSGVAKKRLKTGEKTWKHWTAEGTQSALQTNGGNGIVKYSEHEYVMVPRAGDTAFSKDGWASQ